MATLFGRVDNLNNKNNMKLTKEQRIKLNQTIANLERIKHYVDIEPIELIEHLDAICDSLNQIKKDIESSLEPNYLTYVEFMEKVLNNDIETTCRWYKYCMMCGKYGESGLDFYYRNIQYINETFVPKL